MLNIKRYPYIAAVLAVALSPSFALEQTVPSNPGFRTDLGIRIQ